MNPQPIAIRVNPGRRHTVLTSTGSFDTGRAITNAVAIVVLGPAFLATLRRAARRVHISLADPAQSCELCAEGREFGPGGR